VSNDAPEVFIVFMQDTVHGGGVEFTSQEDAREFAADAGRVKFYRRTRFEKSENTTVFHFDEIRTSND
jgi:phage replication-related protein YjqB (UPF0714/DUF867 family)